MPFHSIVIRIVSSYLQVAGMLQRFDLTLPDAVRTLIAVEAGTSSLSEQLLLFDCGTELRDSASVFVLKQVMSLWVIPISSVFACALFWWILGQVRRKRQASSSAIHPLDGFISSLMVLFYTLFHRSYQELRSHFLVVSMVILNKTLRGSCSQKRYQSSA